MNLRTLCLRAAEQRVRPADVGQDERRRVLDAPVHVRLCGEIDDRIHAVGEQPSDERLVADVAVDEPVARVAFDL